MELFADVAQQYADFARYAHAESPCFEEWALGVVEDTAVQDRIAELPSGKQQPALVFAAARWHGIPAPVAYGEFRRGLLARWSEIRTTVLTRSTQTNEVGRLATLLPALASLGPRLALLEVGASAGLCLYPDRYRYAYDQPGRSRTHIGSGPELTCAVLGPVPLPQVVPEVTWRSGIDLNPLGVDDPDAMAWLQNLVWPEQAERRTRLEVAIGVARTDPPHLIAGDLLELLPSVLERAPTDVPVVVFHSAVIAYLPPEERVRFVEMMTSLVADGRCHWVSNEAKMVLPSITRTGPPVPEARVTFVLGVDGQAVAWTHGHGTSMTWLSPADHER